MAVMQESAAFIPLPKFFETSFGEISKLSSNHLRDNSAFFLKISVFECCKMIVIISKESILFKARETAFPTKTAPSIAYGCAWVICVALVISFVSRSLFWE